VNGTDESFNGKFRNEYLSLLWSRNRLDAKVGIDQWRRHCNDVRPHMSLGDLTPAESKATLCGQFHGGALAGSAGSRLARKENANGDRITNHPQLPFSGNPWSEESRQVTESNTVSLLLAFVGWGEMALLPLVFATVNVDELGRPTTQRLRLPPAI
jgi:putative transposase